MLQYLTKFFLLYFISISALWAFEDHTGLWLDSNVNGSFTKDKKLSYALEAQVQFIDQANYYQVLTSNAALGYRQSKSLSFWLGNQWNSSEPISDFPASYEIWQQVVWQPYITDYLTFRTRTRVEQIDVQHEEEWGNGLREKLTLYFTNPSWKVITPIIYDELFFKLSNPEWAANNETLYENRVFLGVDIRASTMTFFEIGYLQQYLFNKDGNSLNNVLYIGFYLDFDERHVTQFVK